MSKFLTIGPSGAAFTQGAAVVAGGNKSCPRYWLAKKQGLRTKIDDMYKTMGNLDEYRWGKIYSRNNPDATVIREANFEHGLSERTKIFGYIDFTITRENGSQFIVEKKSHISKNKRLQIIRKGVIDESHLAQLCSYLVAKGLTEGVVVNSYYEFDQDCFQLKMTEEREFNVKLKNREIWVDMPTGGFEDIEPEGARKYSRSIIAFQKYHSDLNSLAKYYKILDNAVKNDVLPGRPVKQIGSHSSPCAYCPLSHHCDEAEIMGLDKKQFLSKVKADESRLIEVANAKSKPAEIWAPALKRSKKGK